MSEVTAENGIMAALRAVRLVVVDLEGTLSPRILLTENGTELFSFWPRDLSRMSMVSSLEIQIVVLARDRSSLQEAFARRKIDLLSQGDLRGQAHTYLAKRYSVALENMMFIGDDWADLWWFRRVGVAVAVANATKECRDEAKIVTKRCGGYGAVAEVLELLLKAKGKYDGLIQAIGLASDAPTKKIRK